MKIRIKGNSIRLRLQVSEVRQLKMEGRVEEITQIGDAVFKYALEVDPGLDNLDVRFKHNCITLYCSPTIALEWYDNDVISHKGIKESNDGIMTSLLLEKDFACLDPSHEDQSDNYPNPNKTC